MIGHRTQFNLALMLLLGSVLPRHEASGQACAGPNTGRIAAIVGTFAVAEVAAIAIRGNDWWTTSTTRFHIETRASPSKQQDRLLHGALSYHVSQLGRLAWRWACVADPSASWLGAALGVALSLPKEIGDGIHKGKGFDLADMLWTTAGAVLPALHATWSPSRAVVLKGNYWPSSEYRERTATLPQLENDYAGQRYFLAVNPGRLPSGAGAWPDWLGFALGHSVPNWISAPPVHQWYVTLDLNLRGVPIRAPWWKTVATLLDQVHFPAPGVRLQEGKVAFGLF